MTYLVEPSLVRDVPALDVDLFSDAAMENPYPALREIRDAGPLVWLSRHGLYAIGRFADLQDALRASDVLVSGQGVWFNEMITPDMAPASVLITDGDQHDRWKKLLMRPMMPKALEELRARIDAEAEAIVTRHLDGREFEAMSEMAAYLPTRIVASLVGFNEVGSDAMLRWAKAVFNGLGPHTHPLAQAAVPDFLEFGAYCRSLQRSNLVPGSWADGLFEAAERGELTEDQAREMVFDYATPALDTTILATGEMLYRLATEPGVLTALKGDPTLVANMVLESVRLATPIKAFVRVAASAYRIGDHEIPAGSRVVLLYAAGNRDERHYDDPNGFDLMRNPRDHLGWGYGRHICAGMHLARFEMEALLRQLIECVDRIEAGSPARLRNIGVQGYASLPLRLYPE